MERMVSATTGKPEASFARSEEVVRLGSEPRRLIDVYPKGFQTLAHTVSVFTAGATVLGYRWNAIALDNVVYGLAVDTGKQTLTALPQPAEHESRMAEISWLGNQRELCMTLAGQWVALEGERLIAHGQKLAEVLKQAHVHGVEHPFVVRLPKLHEDEKAIIV